MKPFSPEALAILERAQLDARPDAEAKARNAAALALALDGPPAPANSALVSPTTKLLIGSAIVAMTTAGLIRAFDPAEAVNEPTARPAMVEVLELPPAAAAAPGEPVAPPRVRRAAPAPSSRTVVPPEAPVDPLDEERALLAAARAELNADAPTEALRLLAQASDRFEPSLFDAERYALIARAHCARGSPAAASEAAAHLDPSSPYRNLASCKGSNQ